MEPVATLKRRMPVDMQMCIFCQKKNKGKNDVRKGGKQGIETVRDATAKRKKLNDVQNREVVERLDDVLKSGEEILIVWHRNCYSQYTDKGKIQRLQASQTPQHQHLLEEPPHTSSRSKVDRMNWSLCIFCQKEHKKEKLRAVMTFEMSDRILEAAQFDFLLRVRLVGVSDLMAAEGKYHLPCLVSFTRSSDKTKIASTDANLAMAWLCNELHYAAEKGHVLTLDGAWDRYKVLAEESGSQIPQSFISRRSTFTDKLRSNIVGVFDFVKPHKRAASDILLIPSKYAHIPLSQLASQHETDELLTMPRYEPVEDIFLSMIHVALKIRGDIMSHAGHEGLNVSEDEAIECVPDSLYMFVRLLYGGQQLLESDAVEADEVGVRTKVLSTAQDLVYGISGGKKWTPKHIGLGCSLHQATRSKELVNLFHNAGHVLSYDQILQVDTSLAENTLSSMDQHTGAVIPPNLLQGRFTHFSADNIDILDETLDGKNTFHATQVAAWQRGPGMDIRLRHLRPSTKRILSVPDAMETLIPIHIKHVAPVIPSPVEKEWFNSSNANNDSGKIAAALDLAFHIQRHSTVARKGWTTFNQSLSTKDPPVTEVGYMPIIQAPAHELDTLNTVVRRCMHVSSHLGQRYTVITVDQALYCKVMELKWAVPEFQNTLIPRLGGLHISMCFLKAIGKHMRGSGLAEVWIECGILGQNTTDQVLNGKAYKKAMRSHKLTLQALWRLLMPQLLDYCETNNCSLHAEISAVSENDGDIESLMTSLKSNQFQSMIDSFVSSKTEENVNFTFWWTYMQMVSVLLMFTRAQRDGLWDLHLHSFSCMLPYFMRYDLQNYARWGPIYLIEMHQLPDEVLQEFQQGNFVVKRSSQKFNQVDPDHAQEWLNATGKSGGGIIGITKTTTALSRWALSYNLRSHITSDTKTMFHLHSEDVAVTHSEAKASRQARDSNDEEHLLATLQNFHVFSPEVQPSCLYNVATKDLVTEAIQDSLLHAKDLGKHQLDAFVEERLTWHEGTKPTVPFDSPLHRNNAPTFGTLYEIVKDNKEKDKKGIVKADRSVLQRLLVAYEAGRKVDMQSILKHELMPIPVSLAEMNGSLRTGAKTLISDILTSAIDCPQSVDLQGKPSCLLIDGQAFVVVMGKPAEAKTFGDLGDHFVSSVLQVGSPYQRIDVVFDRYRQISIKTATRNRRTRTTRPIRRVIEGRHVPLPVNWQNFLALPENKADLAQFLSDELIANAPPGKTIVVSGGFQEEKEVKSSDVALDVGPLQASHEEGDTRLVLHAIHANLDNIVVYARDTDVLILLVAHWPHISCQSLWMMAGTAQKRKFIDIKAVYENLPSGVSNALLAFHAITGCDSTSFICNHTKKSAWKAFIQHYHLLIGLGNGELTQETVQDVEKFVCTLYNVGDVVSVNNARCILFAKSDKPEALPPTENALRFHIMRAHYQTLIWRYASVPDPDLPSPVDMGWEMDGDKLKPILMTLEPIPKSCQEIVTCSCKTGCVTLRCGCKKAKMFCSSVCGCRLVEDWNCRNRNQD